MSDQMRAQGEAGGCFLGPMCPRLSSWVHVRLVRELGLLAEKRSPRRWDMCRNLDEDQNPTITGAPSASSKSSSE